MAAVTTSVSHLPLAEVWTGARLTQDFLRGAASARPFYRYRPGVDDLAAALAERRAQACQAERSALVAALGRALERFGATAAQTANLALLADPATVAVVTGQQPGLAGGPLYTFYKAATACLEAERLRADGVPAVPVFWCATEDDDFAEVRSLGLVGRDGAVAHVTLDAAHRPGQLIGEVRLAPAWEQVVADLAARLPASEFGADLCARLRAVGAAHHTLGDQCAALLLGWLGGRGLLWLDPTAADMRALAAPVLARVLDDPLAPTRLANDAGERLAAAGYRPATHRAPDRCGFYLLRDGVRRRLSWRGEQFVSDAAESWSAADLRTELAARPTSFGSSLLLRPVVQDYLLPTALFVVGPGEIAYLAQVGPVYDWLGVARPLLVPRRSLTVVPPRAARVLENYGLALSDFRGDQTALVSRVARAGAGAETSARFATATERIASELDALTAHAAGIDGSLRGAGEGAAGRVRAELDKLEQQTQRALRRRDEVLAQRLAGAAAWLAPGGGLQERHLSLVAVEAQYGPGVTDALWDVLRQLPREAHGSVRMGW